MIQNNLVLCVEAKSKNGHIPNGSVAPSENKVDGEDDDEGGSGEEVRGEGGEVSWSRHICMSGLTFCFKVE